MKRINSAIFLIIVGLMLNGCASYKPNVHPAICTILGAAVGGGAAAAIDDDHDPVVAGGAALGGVVGYLICHKNEPADSDGDGVVDDLDQCPDTPAGTSVDSHGCALVSDSDGDGVNDDQDRCPNTPAGASVDETGCPLDSDGDGVADYEDQCPGTPAGVAVEANGCPKVGETLITLEGVNFEFDSDVVTSDSEYRLDEAVRLLQDHANVNVQVIGHTDSRGSESYNQGLSERRAAAVVNYLISNGIDSYRLSSAGMGESYPIADNSTEEGRYSNRRVELVVVE